MHFDPPLQTGRLIRRYKRFLADIELDGEIITAHCPNPGAMTGCAEPGWSAALSYSPDPRRKLPYTLEMLHNGQSWIGVNTQRANQLVAEALEKGQFNQLGPFQSWQKEVLYSQGCRFDFLLTGPNKQTYLEVKSVTLLDKGMYAFPDSKTARGQKHLQELIKVREQGDRAILLFVVQRQDGQGFKVAREIDPLYDQWFQTAQQKGVEIQVWQAELSPEHWQLQTQIK